MVFRTSKRKSNEGKMLKISAKKEAIAKGNAPIGMAEAKKAKICAQAVKMREQMQICNKYQPFTTKSAKRRPRQVGA